MFYLTLVVTISVLLYMHFVRSFLILKIGRSYRSRGGSVVKIVSTKTLGRIRLFIDENNFRYYGNGERVDDTGLWNEGRLFETI